MSKSTYYSNSNPKANKLAQVIKSKEVLKEILEWDEKTLDYLNKHYGEDPKVIMKTITNFEEYQVFKKHIDEIDLKYLINSFYTEFLIPYIDCYKDIESFSNVNVMSLGDASDIKDMLDN